MLQVMNTHHQNFQNVSLPVNVEGYVFETPANLRAGNWNIRIEKGDAWIFCDRGDIPVKAGESVSLTTDDGKIQIRRLYVKSTVKFVATRV